MKTFSVKVNNYMLIIIAITEYLHTYSMSQMFYKSTETFITENCYFVVLAVIYQLVSDTVFEYEIIQPC